MESSSISVCSLTWNLHGETPEPSTVNLILNQDVKKFDMYVVGTEECLSSILKSFFFSNSKKVWEDLLVDNLGKDDYEVVSSETMNAIHIVVIAKKEIAKKITNIGTSCMATGFNLKLFSLPNKGAVFTWFKYNNVPMMFINCHLTAYRENQPTRNDNYKYITNNMKITNYAEIFGADSSEVTGKDLMNKFHFILWMGDYNSRNDLSGKELLQFIHENKVEEILKGDQLNKAIANGNIDMNGFKEYPIHFSPTYKFIPGEMKKYYINETEGHVPCYADRIFYKVKEDSNIKMNIKSYMTNGQPTLSDHKPVLLLFNLVLP